MVNLKEGKEGDKKEMFLLINSKTPLKSLHLVLIDKNLIFLFLTTNIYIQLNFIKYITFIYLLPRQF